MDRQYGYGVRSVDKYVRPDYTNHVYQHQDFHWLTLITCKDYDEENDK